MSADDDPGVSDPEMRAMRAVWLSMRDEEPPDRGIAELLAAARAHVPKAPAPWWRGALASLRRPPVLAFATVLVLLGGAVVLGRHGVKSAKVDEPTLAGGGTREATTVEAGSSTQREEAPPPGEAAPPRDDVRDVKRAHSAQAKLDGADSAIGGRAEGQAQKGLAAPPPVTVTAPVPVPAPPPQSPPPTQTLEDEAPAHKAPMADSVRFSSDEATSTGDHRAGAAQLVQQCESAAARGDCAAVKVLVERIRKLDAGYRARVAKDSPIGKCLD